MAWESREGTRKAKTQLEWRVSSGTEEKQRKMKETYPLKNQRGDTATTDMEKAEAFNNQLFCLILPWQMLHPTHRIQCLGLENEILPTIDDQVQGHLRNVKLHRSTGPNEMHPWVSRKLADEMAKPLYVILEKLWQSSEVPADWKRRNITPIIKKGKKRVLPLCTARSWSTRSWTIC